MIEVLKKLKELSKFVYNIKIGYFDKDGVKHLDEYASCDENYKLQTPDDLRKSKTGLSFDIVEIYRDFFIKNNINCESYLLYYNDGKITDSNSFIIYEYSNKWFVALDNTSDHYFYCKGANKKNYLIKQECDKFQAYIKKFKQDKLSLLDFAMCKYDFPKDVYDGKMSLEKLVLKSKKQNKQEYSGLAIVFCSNQVLLLQTLRNEYVFPKGHIEKGETSKDASIRECLEESGVDIKNAYCLGNCGNYQYTFSTSHFKYNKDELFNPFGNEMITKHIDCFAYVLDQKQAFHLENIFSSGIWVDAKKAKDIISYDNTLEIYNKALELYDNFKTGRD